ncbi:tetratricopeptide repeat protein [Halocynthiibacter sp. C4]|uniref:heme biosynthesis protein HemY n=1 Tax=Halocynthiibacter sp. C4 TaxID=2992758 RepID=UPI00237BF684|nr:heme biosynthesis HemY N-terminal domain-containing protein [Halocynthiibacter sp. C4]MDE0591038.1 tetratricopeptide repeat protein [Halocynthiibacter sp. C4]
MLWSLVKILGFVVLIALLAYGAGLLAESSEGVRIVVANMEFTLQPLQAAIAAGLLLLVVWVIIRLVGLCIAVLRFLNGDETAISRYFNRNRERKGYEAMAEGLVAISSGDGRVALAKAAKAEKYLHRPELTNLLTAQAAELSGDSKKAEEVYKRLLTDDRTRFVGIRGILKQRLAEGDTDTALKLAEKAFVLKPRNQEMQDTLLQLQADHGDWSGARKTLQTKVKYGGIPRDVYKRRDAVLALSEVSELIEKGATIEAREAAIAMHKQSPELVPGTVLAADAYIEEGRPKLATRILKKTWPLAPHPDLAAAFARIEPNESAADRLRRFEVLTKLNPDHPETRMLLAELNIAADDFPEARRAMGDLAETHPTARSLSLMAAIERGQGGDDAAVRGWLSKALVAPRGEQWVCEKCGTPHQEWRPVCQSCKSFDTLSWKVPEDRPVQGSYQSEMLPIIVGAEADEHLDKVVESEQEAEEAKAE